VANGDEANASQPIKPFSSASLVGFLAGGSSGGGAVEIRAADRSRRTEKRGWRGG